MQCFEKMFETLDFRSRHLEYWHQVSPAPRAFSWSKTIEIFDLASGGHLLQCHLSREDHEG